MATGTTKQNLNLRGDPSTNNPPLQTIPKGTTIQIIGTAGDWLQVQAPDGTKGYVLASFVDLQPADTTSQTTQPVQSTQTNPPVQTTLPPAPVIGPPAAAVTTTTLAKLLVPIGQTLNIRSSPAISANPDNKIETVQSDAVLTPIESDSSVAAKIGTTQQQNQWVNVRTPGGNTGYVAAWLVTFQGSAPPQSTGATGSATDLDSYLAGLTAYSIPQGYYDFQAQRQKLGLPDPFDVLPTNPGFARLSRMPVNGFGPNSFAFGNWRAYYSNVCGMHNGLDHIVPLGTPLLAVGDGVIVGTQENWQFLGNANDKSIILWPFLPDSVRDSQGRRMLSNVLVAYGHLSDNSVVKRHDVVKAGQTIGISGRPFGETSNDHLHMEIHLLSGDSHLPRNSSRRILSDYKPMQPFSNICPFNPILFFSERMVRYHLNQGQKVGYGGGPTYPTAAMLGADYHWPPLDFFSIGQFQYGNPPIWTVKSTPWPAGVFDMPTLNARIANYTPFAPYPADFL